MFHYIKKLVGMISIFFVMTGLCIAAVIEIPEPGNNLTADVTVEVERDPSTLLYTYRYIVSNRPSSIQSLEDFFIQTTIDIDIISALAPEGWRFDASEDKRLFTWSAVGITEADIPADWDGNALPSPFQIVPGEAKSGFILQTFSSPGEGLFYARGFTRLAVADDSDDFVNEGIEVLSFPNDSFQGITTVPIGEIYDGNRRPGVDGFLGFVNLDPRNNDFVAPATFYLKFSLNGETVDQSTFKALLNNEDVTQTFIIDPLGTGNLVGSFDLLSSPLKVGRNVLLTEVDGELIGNNGMISIVTDTDRIAFEVLEVNAGATSSPMIINFDSSTTN